MRAVAHLKSWSVVALTLSACGGDPVWGPYAEAGTSGKGDGAAPDPGPAWDGGSQDGSSTGDPPSEGPESCKQVDLIISVDGSSSMTEELKAMRDEVFPAFAERLRSVGGSLDNFRVATLDGCPDPASYHTRGKGGQCNFSSGEAWIESHSPDLTGEFACVGDIFQQDARCSGDNDDEQPASAAAASLEAPYSTGANAGFSRRDALLVVLAITDEDEQPTGPARSAREVHDRLVAAKGDADNVVFIGIGAESDCKGEYGSAWEARKLRNITNQFIAHDRGVWHNLCEGRLEDSLDDALRVIDSACDEFEVPII